MNDCLHWGGVQRVAFMVKEKRCGRRQRFRDARGPRFAQAPKDDQDMRPADVHWLKVITRPSTRFQQDLESIAFFFFQAAPYCLPCAVLHTHTPTPAQSRMCFKIAKDIPKSSALASVRPTATPVWPTATAHRPKEGHQWEDGELMGLMAQDGLVRTGKRHVWKHVT